MGERLQMIVVDEAATGIDTAEQVVRCHLVLFVH
jgi:hypothetical protein